MSERFSEEDLAPDSSARRATRTWMIDRLAAATGVTAAGLVLGGMLALGAAAAPAVFSLTPRPFSGHAMGQAFTRFGQIALGAACVALLVEVVRALLHRRTPQRPWDRVRRLVSIGVAGCAATMAFNLTPAISRLHESGAVRGEGEQGMLLEATHRRAELVGKLESGLALTLIFLHVLTLRGRVEDDEEVSAPLPPGPRP
jgi:hypothetical protein